MTARRTMATIWQIPAAGMAVVASLLLVPSLGSVGVARAAGGDSIYTSPGNATFTTGQTFVVEIHENSNNDPINAVQVLLDNSPSLRFNGIDTTGSAFNVSAEKSNNNGTIDIAFGSTQPLTGDKLVAKISYTATSAGGTVVHVQDSSILVSSVSHKNVADTRTGSSFTINSPGGNNPSPTPVPRPVPTPIPVPSPGSPPNVTVTPNPTPATPDPQPVLLPDDSQIQVDQPSTLQTTPSTDKTVQKVEYYINGKLVMTVKSPPFSYSVDSSNMLNGTYKLVTKTYYSDGKVDTTTADLIVKNPLNAKQVMLQLQHYAWLIILLALIIAALIWFKFFRRGNGGDDGYGSFGGDAGTGGDYNPYGPPPSQYPQSTIPPSAPPSGDGQQFPPSGSF